MKLLWFVVVVRLGTMENVPEHFLPHSAGFDDPKYIKHHISSLTTAYVKE